MIQDLDLRLISLVSLLLSELYDFTKIHIIESTIKGFFFPIFEIKILEFFSKTLTNLVKFSLEKHTYPKIPNF
jgi:hypothetical protein